jgi:rhodanese-related sulfurtransferase
LEKRAWRVGWRAAALVALSAAVAAGVNGWRLARHSPSGLEWVGDWDSYVETKALEAGVGIVLMAELLPGAADGPAAVLDARPGEMYAAGHIPGAWSCPAGEVDAALAGLAAVLDPAERVAVYCDGAACSDSLELAKELMARGFAKVELYPGGWSEWTAAGGAVEVGEGRDARDSSDSRDARDARTEGGE